MRTCPRCKQPFNWIERRKRGDKTYYYAVHVVGKDSRGERKVRKCYLGADKYDYVSRLHVREGLVFKGLVCEDRVLSYLDALTNSSIDKIELSPDLALKLAERFMRIAQKLKEYAEKYAGEKAFRRMPT